VSKLPYLVNEINAAMEVYLSGRTGQQYNRTAFILCDDCAELASKLFLLTDKKTWSDKKPGVATKPCPMNPPPPACPRHPANIAAPPTEAGFKSFRDVTADVRAVFLTKRAADHPAVDALLNSIESRRDRRNKFFHSTDLLDLTLQPPDCVRALVDLLDYGKLLFGATWDTEVAAAGNMETCEAVLRVDKKSYADPSVGPKMNSLLQRQPRLGVKPVKKGCEVAHHPEDLHLRLAIRNGNKDLRDKLRALI
jgi:hypothetical protein